MQCVQQCSIPAASFDVRIVHDLSIQQVGELAVVYQARAGLRHREVEGGHE